jgi:hypothetical protein
LSFHRAAVARAAVEGSLFALAAVSALSAFLLRSAFDLEIANRPRPQLLPKPQLYFRNAGVPPALLNCLSI